MSGLPAEGTARVHVFRVTEERAEDRAVLNDEERERAERFHFERDRVQFVAAHAALRRTLGDALGVAATEVVFGREEGGRPFLAGPSAEDAVCFSLSHSGALALVAIGRSRTMGVDVEAYRDGVNLVRLAERNYSDSERAALRESEGDGFVRDFYRVWTRKEAYVKALGKGLYHALDAFDVNLGVPARFLAFRDGSVAEEWSLTDLDVGEGFGAALAIRPAVHAVELVPPR